MGGPAGRHPATDIIIGACTYRDSFPSLHPANPCDFARRLGYGKGDKVTFTGNYIHHTSGRSPKIEYNSHWHAYNNYWSNNTGHAFDVGEGSNVLIEGNVFDQVKTPFLDDSSPGQAFAVSSDDKSTCDSKLSRTCVANSLTSSGSLSAKDQAVLSSWPSGEGDITVLDASKVQSHVLKNAGVGKASSSSSSTLAARQFHAAPPTPSATTPTTPKWSWKTVGVKPT